MAVSYPNHLEISALRRECSDRSEGKRNKISKKNMHKILSLGKTSDQNFTSV
jgi:hypothetical protein